MTAPDSPFFVRLFLMVPKRRQEERVSQILDDLVAFLATQPGCIQSYKIERTDVEGEVGRLVVWESEQASDRAAMHQHVLALRSELMQLVDEETYLERAFFASGPHRVGQD
jgi:quinol monooxygenase YgiN